jgi:hypothetical protein
MVTCHKSRSVMSLSSAKPCSRETQLAAGT